MEIPSDPDGSEWLEKIIQAAFDLPPIHQYDLQQLFLEGLERVVGPNEPNDLARWHLVFFEAVAPWLRTPRDAGRLLNALSVSWPAVEGEVDLADFVAIETVRLFEPKLFAFIRESGDALVLGSPVEDKMPSFAQNGKKELTRKLIKLLFPSLETSTYHDQDVRKIWRRQKRICCRERFSSYFTFGTGEDVLSRAELDSFMGIVGHSRSMLQKVKECVSQERRTGGTRAAVLLDEFGAHVDRLGADQIAPATKNFLQYGDAFLNPSDDRSGFFQVPAVSRVWRVIHALLSRLNLEVRECVMRDAVAQSPALATVSHTVLSLADEHGMHHEEDIVAPENRLLPETVVRELEQALADRIKAAAEEGILLKSRYARMIMINWQVISGASAVRTWTDAVLDDDASVISLAKLAITQILSSNADVTFRVDRGTWENIVDFDRLIFRVGEIEKHVDLGDAEKEVFTNFRQGLRNDKHYR